ncbi:MAG TPA: DUF308 domain-containing protein [Ktedonobacterales bacterium]
MDRPMQEASGEFSQPNREVHQRNEPSSEVLQMTERLTRWWWLWLVMGILWIIASLIILQFQAASVVTVGVIIGVLFLVAGIQEFFIAAIAPSWKWLWIVLGIFLVIGGIYALVNPIHTFVAIADMLGFLFLLVGVFWTIEAFATRSVYDLWFLGLIAGIMMIVLGFWTGGQFLAVKASTLLIFVGIWTLCHGVTDLIRAFRIKHLAQQVPTLATN